MRWKVRIMKRNMLRLAIVLGMTLGSFITAAGASPTVSRTETVTVTTSQTRGIATPSCTSMITYTAGIFSDGVGGQEWKVTFDSETADCDLLRAQAECSVDGGNKQFVVDGSWVDLGGTSIADCTGGTIVGPESIQFETE